MASTARLAKCSLSCGTGARTRRVGTVCCDRKGTSLTYHELQAKQEGEDCPIILSRSSAAYPANNLHKLGKCYSACPVML